VVFGFLFGDEIVKDLTLFFVGRFRESRAEQFHVFVMSELIHDRTHSYQ